MYITQINVLCRKLQSKLIRFWHFLKFSCTLLKKTNYASILSCSSS